MLEQYWVELFAIFLASQLAQLGFEARILWKLSSLQSDVERNTSFIDGAFRADGGRVPDDD